MSEHANTDDKQNHKLQEFSYAISHDLGAAIRGVSQLTSLLEQDINDKINDKERYWMQLIKASADKAQAMIEAMTLYTRLASSNQQDSSFSLDALIESKLAKCLAENKTNTALVTPNIGLNLEHLEIEANRKHWILFLCSLINNAIQFQHTDLSAGKHPEIVISLERLTPLKCAKLTIEDNGVGVSDARFSGLSKPFSSTQNQDMPQHLGMGLSYCARIAELNQADLRFGQSRLGGFKVEYEFSI